MAPILDNISESMGGGIRVSVGGRELFTSRAYIQLQASDMSLAHRSIPIEFCEGAGTVEIVSPNEQSVAMVRMAELAAKGEVATGITHDVNNLLCALSGSMELLASEVRQNVPEMKGIVTDMQVAIDSITSVMKRMGRLVLSKNDLSRENVHELVASAFLLIKKKLQVEWSTGGREVAVFNAVPASLEADMVYPEVQLALVNIMLNALEHGIERKGKIEIRGFRDESHVYLEIENNGKPVPESVRGDLLNRPVTTDCNHGYGLYTAARNVRAFGGDISFESTEGSTMFTIILPYSGTCG
jgi:signal transduction histidine kinase